jgi:flavodoxin
MSHFMPKLHEDGRNDTTWPAPGTWKQGQDISHLAIFADKLDVSKASKDTDLLNSVPTPWARLLLFETALFDTRHPSHKEILKQWRGLLGTIAFSRALGLNVKASDLTINLRNEGSAIAKTFLDLRPDQTSDEDEVALKKWEAFQLISVDDQIVGATSPRTLVFTGIAHRCSPSIPFQTLNGRLADPLTYYRKYRDKKFLSLLYIWVTGLLADCGANQHDLNPLLGTVRKGNEQMSRLTRIQELLDDWKAEILNELGTEPVDVSDSTPAVIFSLQPYGKTVRGLPVESASKNVESDLLLKGRKENVIVCYRPEDNADKDCRLLDNVGNRIQNESIRLYDGWWHDADRPLPNPVDFLPSRLNVEVVNDPVEKLFEEHLIQVALPPNSDSVHSLRLSNAESAKTYLYPFKSDILTFLDVGTIAKNTMIAADPLKKSIKVSLDIPLVNGRMIRAEKDYSHNSNVVVNTDTAELASWPDFASEAWKHYFYFKNSLADPEIDFKPITADLPRQYGDYSWYKTEKPVEAFVGSVGGKSGLLLLRYATPPSIATHWKISVDFGSTHTRAFYLPMQDIGKGQFKPNGEIQCVPFSAYARPLTLCGQNTLDINFFPTVGRLKPEIREELKSLLMTPMPTLVEENDWLPREGFAYMHWLFEGEYDENRLKDNIKWEENRTKYDLRAFLRCLLTMIQAEAAKRGAKIVSVSRAYPTAFTSSLEQQHKEEWDKLGQAQPIFIGEALSEAVATCRYLEAKQNAPTTNNAISLDVGGSTTDIAIWAGTSNGDKKVELKLQESVKMAAGIVGRYLQSPIAEGFLTEFAHKMRDYRDDKKELDLTKFAGTRSGYALVFYSFLTFLELKRKKQGTQELGNIVDWIKTANDIEGNGNRELISHITFLFAGLTYYVGLLCRKAGLMERNTYNLYFCGKGGTLIEWINNFNVLAQKMFEAGLFGPTVTGNRTPPKIFVHRSEDPKEEVGRGLLAKSSVEANTKRETVGLIDDKEFSVTVGESGYQGLQWDQELTSNKLGALPLEVPAMDQLVELQNFISAFKNADLRTTFDFDSVDHDLYRDQLQQRLFVRNRGEREEDTLVEPLFITELKVLQEMLGKNNRLFD